MIPRHFLYFLALILASSSAFAVINPGLQPSDLYLRYGVVLALKVTTADAEKRVAQLELTRVLKGDFAPKKIELTLSDPEILDAFDLIGSGSEIIAYVGSGRQADKLCFYTGGGRWQIGTKDPKDPSLWLWTQDLDPKKDGTGMSGTFNGAIERLVEMMDDMAAGRYYFPAVPAFQFGDDLPIGHFEKPIGGVALYDIDGDGKLDIYASSAGGDRVYLQTGGMKFTEKTEALGLAGIQNPSVSFADVNADGRPDLLAGAVIHLAEGDGAGRRFRATELLPKAAAEKLKYAAFVDLNNDGYPDVVVSTLGVGLDAYLNPGASGGNFKDATAALGLDQEACGAGLTGYFAPGDWNGDGRTDLFYAVGNGLLLVQGADGRFQPLSHDLDFDFKTDGKADGLTGACVFAPLWSPGQFDLVATAQYKLQWVGMRRNLLLDLIPYGNEIWEGTDS
ncbi:MAG: VCBS repeat-containing protein, partial [Opitutaceae bacterium]|nr:VCBS repeat-containing protein [Verrucomicrobiales bacterium]